METIRNYYFACLNALKVPISGLHDATVKTGVAVRESPPNISSPVSHSLSLSHFYECTIDLLSIHVPFMSTANGSLSFVDSFFNQISYHVISVEWNVMQKDRSIGNDDDHDTDDDGDDKEALGKKKK